MLDYGALPPEINSARIYAGPGSGPMLAAAAAWQGLAAELSSAAVSYQSVVSELTSGSWLGPTSMSMVAAVVPYVTWLSATADQAEHAGIQATAAAGAYETARAATVPPPVVVANRTLLAALVATNFLGQNTPAVAATEAHYGEMWAQDAAAMYGYAGASAAATTVTPFAMPPQITNLAGQAAAVAHAAGISAVAHAQEVMAAGTQLISSVPQTLHGLASPASALSSASDLRMLTMPLRMAMFPMRMLTRLFMMGGTKGAARAVGTGVPALESGLGSAVQAGTVASASPVAAGVGRAFSIGALSVPQSWSAPVPSMGPAAAALPAVTVASTTPAVHPGAPAAIPPMMPTANTAARDVGSVPPRLVFDVRPSLFPRSPAGG